MEDPRVTDPDYDYDSPDADKFAQEMIDTFEEVFASKTTAEWVEELNAKDIPCGPIRFSEDLAWDEQAVANNYIIELEHHTGQRYRDFWSDPQLHRRHAGP